MPERFKFLPGVSAKNKKGNDRRGNMLKPADHHPQEF
jgi:hypothetical protein